MQVKYFLFAFLLFTSLCASAQKTIDAKGEPVIVNKDTLFQFYAPQGLFDPKERAEQRAKRGVDANEIAIAVHHVRPREDRARYENEVQVRESGLAYL